MALNNGHAFWLNHRQESDSDPSPGMALGLWLAAFYVVGMLFVIAWAQEKVNLHEPEESYIVLPCLREHPLRFPLLIFWPGLLWPIFAVYVCLRQRRDRRRANELFEGDANNGTRLENIKNNQGTEPLHPPPLPPAHQSVDHDHHSPEEGGEREGTQIQRERGFV